MAKQEKGEKTKNIALEVMKETAKTIGRVLITSPVFWIIIGIILLILLLAMSFYGNNSKSTQQTQESFESAMATLQSATSEDGSYNLSDLDLSMLVDIKGDESSGYHLEFKEGVEELIDEIYKKDQKNYKNIGITDSSILKKFIKASIVTEFPNLGSSKVNSGSYGSIDDLPDLGNEKYYPRAEDPDGEGWCQWYAGGRIREVYRIEIPYNSDPPAGSDPNAYPITYQDWLVNTYGEYFEKSPTNTPEPGSLFYATTGNHIGFVKAVDPASGTMVVEEGNIWYSEAQCDVYIDWTKDYGIRNRGPECGVGYTYWCQRTVSIDEFSANNGYVVPTEAGKQLLKSHGANITTTNSSTSSKKTFESLNGFLFIGDSITEGMATMTTAQGQKIITDDVTAKTVVGASPGDWLNTHFDTLPENSDSIKAISIMLGTNNKQGTEKEMENMKQLLEKLQDRYAGKTIFVQKIIPGVNSDGSVIDTEGINKKLEEICSELDNTICIDATEGFELRDSTYYAQDNCHLNAEGYKKLYEQIKEKIINSTANGENVNEFQGTIKIRRITPDIAPGQVKDPRVNEDEEEKQKKLENLNGILFIGDQYVRDLENSNVLSGQGITFAGVSNSAPENWLDEDKVYAGETDGTQETWKRLPENNEQINAICMLLGSNSMHNSRRLDIMQQLLEKIHAEYKDKTIYIIGLLPDSKETATINVYNEELLSLCNKLDYTVYVDCSKGIVEEDEYELGGHLEDSGYKKLGDNIIDQLVKKSEEEEKANEDKIVLENLAKEIMQYEGVSQEGLGTAQEIPEDVKNKIIGYTISEADAPYLDQFAYLTMPYVGFDGQVKEGHMIVNRTIAKETLEIFQELYNIKYPIQNMEIVEEFGGKGAQSEAGTDMENSTNVTTLAAEANDTYCFAYNPSMQDEHHTGMAITLNPKINPVANHEHGVYMPVHKNAEKYLYNRWGDKDNWSDVETRACIDEYSDIYNVFDKYEWNWQGQKVHEADMPRAYFGTFTKPNEEQRKEQEEKKEDENKEEEYAYVKTKVMDLSYVPEETFNNYLSNNDRKAINVYTFIEEEGVKKIQLAKWTYVDGEYKIQKSKPIDYKAALSKYTVPVEYFLAILMNTQDKDFTSNLADLVMDSEYIIAVEESITSTETTRTISKQTNEGTTTTTETSVKQTVSQKIEVTYVDCWFMKYQKDISFSTHSINGQTITGPSSDSNSTNNGDIVNIKGEKGDYIGSFEVSEYSPDPDENGGEQNTATKTGEPYVVGLTIAVDPSVIPLGSYVYFEDHVYKATDIGGAIIGNHIDRLVATKEEEETTYNVPVYWAKNVDENGTNSESTGEEVTPTVSNRNPVNLTSKIKAKVDVSTPPGSVSQVFDEESGANLVITLNTKRVSVNYDTGNDKVLGNSQRFVNLYRSDKAERARKYTDLNILIEILNENTRTAPLAEITRYLFTQAKDSSKATSIKFQEYAPGQFESNLGGLDLFVQYIRMLERRQNGRRLLCNRE